MNRTVRLGSLLCAILLLLAGCKNPNDHVESTEANTEIADHLENGEIRAVWLSYLELSMLYEDGSEESFRAKAQEIVTNLYKNRLNAIFLHVRAFSDAFYCSDIFPYSKYLTGTEGKDPGYDALKIFCEYAEAAGLSVHAWINPFRIGTVNEWEDKAESNPAKRLLSDGDPSNDNRIATVGDTMYYDPSNAENQDLILEGVRELLSNYPINGIHIDDYFYPTTDASIDRKAYDAYRAAGGSASRDDWRRTQISHLVRRLYICVKSFGNDKVFSISPGLQIDKNRDELYADVCRWCETDGYCDWIIPQIYVGFTHETFPFCETVDEWMRLHRNDHVRILIGLAAYKCAAEDPYAGSGKREWIDHTDILARQVEYIRSIEGCSGFAFYSYSYLFSRNMPYNSNSESNSVISVL